LSGIPKAITRLGLGSFSHTLFIPLACRAREAVRPHPLLMDPISSEVFKHLGGDKSWLMGLNSLDETFIVMRARQFDRFTQRWLESHPDGLVVDLGCGLDTRYDRVDNSLMNWIGLDLPEVIALRRNLLPDRPRAMTITQSMLDFSWMDIVKQKASHGVLFLAEGVFSYFSETEVQAIITKLADQFSGNEIVFDAYTSFSVAMHNRTHSPLKDTATALKWGLDDPVSLDAWGAQLLEKWGYFDHYEPRVGAGYLMKFIPGFAKSVVILHYRLGA